jgi:hypothetical protein
MQNVYRVLVDTDIDGTLYRCNDLVKLDKKIAAEPLVNNLIDDNDAAVGYLVEQGANPKEHALHAESHDEQANTETVKKKKGAK